MKMCLRPYEKELSIIWLYVVQASTFTIFFDGYFSNCKENF